MAPRLKVFVTSDGLTDYAVAATSRTKALAAWGVRQDVFKEGLAHETDDPALVALAQARPGEVVRRPAGTRRELAALKPRPKAKPPPQPKPAPAPKPKGPSKAQLKKVADLEAKLARLDAGHEAERADLARQQAELARRAEALEAQQAAQRRTLEAALSAARQAPGSSPPDSGPS
jgi:hypothetical protein